MSVPLPVVSPVPPEGLLIGEVATRLGISPDALRYYEREGLTLAPPRRGSDGRRRYRQPDVEWLAGLLMLRGTGMSIQEMREFSVVYRDAGDAESRLRLLELHRARVVERLQETQKHLAALDIKISFYRCAPGSAPGHTATPDAAHTVFRA